MREVHTCETPRRLCGLRVQSLPAAEYLLLLSAECPINDPAAPSRGLSVRRGEVAATVGVSPAPGEGVLPLGISPKIEG